jgi:hypothetical protein
MKTTTSIYLVQKNNPTPLKVGEKKKKSRLLLAALDWVKNYRKKSNCIDVA